MGSRHRSFVAAVALALGLSISVAGPTAAAGGGQDGPRIEPIHGQLDGRTAGELLADGFVPFYAVPVEELQPCLRLGDTGGVQGILPGETCEITEGTPVLISLGVACSDAEAEPFFAEGAKAQRRCAREGADALFASIHVSVDGGPAVRLAPGGRFTDTSPQFSTTAVEGNLVGAEPGPMTFVAYGWQGVLTGLTVGEHALRVDVVLTDGTVVVHEATVVVTA